ncbi:retrovirus-related pol polyprotein from transposon TNT 1-94 [Tanacetum coccineum]
MKDTKLSYQEHECRLYNLFDKFAYVQGETLYEYYWRFSQLINDMHTIGMTMQQVQVITKFLNALPTEWSKFVTDVILAVPMFQQGEDLIECINKACILSDVASRFPPSNNQLRTSSNPRNQATIQDGRVTVQQVQGRQNQSYASTGNKVIVTTSKGNYRVGQPKVVKCYNCQGEGHIARQCTQPKRTRNVAWFKENLMLAEAQEAGQILDEEQYAFLADTAFQTKDLDAYDSDCDPEVLSEVPYSNFYLNDMINQESQDAVIQDTNSSAPNDLLVLSLVEQMTDHVPHLDKENQTNKMMYRSMQAMYMLMKPQVFYDDTHKQALGYQNPFHLKKAQQHDVVSVFDDEETLILEKESRSKMLDKQNDPISIEKKIKISPIDYSKLNKIKEDFGKCFVTIKEFSVEQAFWLKHSSFYETPIMSHTLVRIEAPSKLPKVSLVNESLKMLKYQLANFDNVVKKRTTSDAITAGAWDFEHTEACFVTKIIPFLNVLKDTFNAFDKTLLDEITKVQTVFNRMKAAVDQCSVETLLKFKSSS